MYNLQKLFLQIVTKIIITRNLQKLLLQEIYNKSYLPLQLLINKKN